MPLMTVQMAICQTAAALDTACMAGKYEFEKSTSVVDKPLHVNKFISCQSLIAICLG